VHELFRLVWAHARSQDRASAPQMQRAWR
jgi:hypothetical protein